MEHADLTKRWREVLDRMAQAALRAGRAPESVRLVAVPKDRKSVV